MPRTSSIQTGPHPSLPSLLLLMLVGASSQNWATNKFSNFTITKYEKDDNLDPASPTFVNTPKQVSEKTYTGSMVTNYTKSEGEVTVYVYYRELPKDSIKSSEVLEFTLRYNRTSKSDTISQTVNRSSIFQVSLKNKKIDQEIQTFPRTLTPGVSFLRRLDFTSSLTATTYVYPVALDLYFEDFSYVYHLVIDKDSVVVDTSLPANWATVLLVLSTITALISPFTFNILYTLYSENPLRLEKSARKRRELRNQFFPS